MAKIITLGEIMLRLSPEGQDRFILVVRLTWLFRALTMVTRLIW